MPNKQITKASNKAAGIITRTKPTEHITPVLKDLHWLPVEYRIKFKILCFAYNCKNGAAPEYISELLENYQPSRHLRSSSADNLTIPNIKSSFGSKAFSYNAPKLWNDLPLAIKKSRSIGEFKSALKTYFFCLCY